MGANRSTHIMSWAGADSADDTESTGLAGTVERLVEAAGLVGLALGLALTLADDPVLLVGGGRSSSESEMKIKLDYERSALIQTSQNRARILLEV